MRLAAAALVVLLIVALAAVGYREAFSVCPDGKTRCVGCECCPDHTLCPGASPDCPNQCGFAMCPDGVTRCDGCQCCPDGTLCPNGRGCTPGMCPNTPGGKPWAPLGPGGHPWAPLGPGGHPWAPLGPGGDGTYVELVNGTGTVLLAAALGPTPVLPREGRWHFGPGETLTIDIPAAWKHTQGSSHVNGPRFWVRTGCAYDPASGKTQCETGDCGGAYDCSAAGLAGVAPASLAEFCFECGDGLTWPRTLPLITHLVAFFA